MTFDDIARTITPALERRNYLAVKDPKPADLFIVINWGTTTAPEHRTMDPAYEEMSRAQKRAENNPATIQVPHSGKSIQVGVNYQKPGYTAVMDGITNGMEKREMDGGGDTWNLGANNNKTFQGVSPLSAENDMWETISRQNARMLGYSALSDAELQKYRYFVVLLAYDYKTIANRKPKLLWEARMSISEHRNQFDRKLSALVENASAYFGQNSNGLTHKAVPIGLVHIGQLRSLDFPVGSDSAALSADGTYVAYLKKRGSDSLLAIVGVDKPNDVSFERLPTGDTPSRVTWNDPARIRVGLDSAGTLSYDKAAKSWSTPTDPQSSFGQGTILNLDEIQARVEVKFPHRTTTVLGSDKLGRRYLVAVNDSKENTRFYVYDSGDDVLVQVGKSGRDQ
jgi:hypothetical protein